MQKLGDHLNEKISGDDEDEDVGEEEYTHEEKAGQTLLSHWTASMTSYLTQVVALKLTRIKTIGDKHCGLQLVSDITFFKKLLVQIMSEYPE